MPTSICILNYNSFEDTIECVDSLLKQTIQEFTIVIVDNASGNNSVVKITNHLRENNFTIEQQKNTFLFSNKSIEIYVLESEKNRGFSAGNNISIKFIKENLKSDRILFLNNDTVVPNDFLEKMEEEYLKLLKDKPIALSSCEFNYFTHKKTHNGIQYLNLFTGLTFNLNLFPSLKYICGACLLIDVNVPFMDDSYFLYYEDAQYSKNLKELGYRFVSTSKTKYYHKESATTSSLDNKLKYQFTSMWHFFRENYSFLIPIVLITRYVQHLISRRTDKNKLLISTLRKSGDLCKEQ